MYLDQLVLILDLESRRVNLLKSSITYLDTTIEHSTALFTPEVNFTTEVKFTSQSVNGPIIPVLGVLSGKDD